jgi:DNA-binding transcriptional MocR family regulator
MARYRAIADEIVAEIETGALARGDKLPSLRDACQRWQVSLITAKGAYRLLERQGFIEARPQSGYYVLPHDARNDPTSYSHQDRITSPNEELSVIRQILGANSPEGFRAMGAAIPGAEFLPLQTLTRYAARMARQAGPALSHYDSPSGSVRLREEISRYYRALGAKVRPEDLVIHNGALDAITTSLRSITRPGDTIVLECPTYYLFMHAAAALGLKVVTIPHIPGEGIDLKALSRALRSRAIKAVVAIPNFHNPAGTVMSIEAKEEVLYLTERHNSYIVEDDVYGDLSFNGERPPPLLALDTKGRVIHCSSVSKILGPGLRVGWSISRSLRPRIEESRFLGTISCPSLTQEVVAEYLSCEGLKRHRTRMGVRLAANGEVYRAALKDVLPPDSKITRPQGGFLFWVELPKGADTTALFHALKPYRAPFTPGVIFGRHIDAKRFFRFSFGAPYSPSIEHSITRLGELVRKKTGSCLISGD